MFSAKISKDQLTPTLKQALATLQDLRPFLLVWGQAVARQARTNARAKGGRRFWREIAMSTQVQSVGTAAVSVHSTHIAAAQKQYGGDISAPGKGPGAKPARALTIPIGEARGTGKTAREYEMGGRDLFVLKTDKTDPDKIGILGYSVGDEFHALFALRRRVTQAPEPWFPQQDTILALGASEATHFLGSALHS